MKTLDRYLLKELTIPLVISTVALVLLFQANILIFLFKQLNVSVVPFAALIQVILFKTPDFIKMTLVVGTGLASSLAFSRLARESELVAMLSAKITLGRVILPVLGVGFIVSLVDFLVIEKIGPPSEQAYRRLLSQLFVLSAAPEFKTDVVIELPNYTAHFGTVSRNQTGGIQLDKILLFEHPRPDEYWVYLAENGSYKEGAWSLKKPLLTMLKKNLFVTARPQKDLQINERIKVPDFWLFPNIESKSLEELQEEIQKQRKQGLPTTDLEIAYQSKFAVPAACLIFSLLGPAFAIKLARRGPFAGVLLTMVSALLYYNLFLISSQVLGKQAWIGPTFAVWTPNILFFLASLIALRKAI